MEKQDKEEVPVAVAVGGEKGVNFLETTPGVLFRQDAQLAEVVAQAFGLPCEKKNRFTIAPLPVNKKAKRTLGDAQGWTPSQAEIDGAPYAVTGQEESDCFVNVLFFILGCVNLRPFTMKWTAAGTDELFELQRPFTCGGICCCPHNVSVMKNGQLIGKVQEDWNCSNWLCRYCAAVYCCKVPYDVQIIQNGQLVNRYNIDFNFACCGNHNNCCGATPCCRNQLWNVTEYTNGGINRAPIGYIQKTFGDACGCSSCYRWCCAQAENFIIEWPTNATVEERAMFIAATTLLTYIFFEQKGG